MKKTMFLIYLLGLLPFLLNAQTSPGIEISENNIHIQAKENVNIVTGSNGKAYYNDKEIATKDIQYPSKVLKVCYIDLQTVERKDGVENGVPYSDFLILQHNYISSGYQWCGSLEYQRIPNWYE